MANCISNTNQKYLKDNSPFASEFVQTDSNRETPLLKLKFLEDTNKSYLPKASIIRSDSYIEEDLNNSFEKLLEKFKKELNKLNEAYHEDEKIDSITEYLKESIEIKIESLKNKLDLLKEKLFDDLEHNRNEAKKKVNEIISINKNPVVDYEKCVAELSNTKRPPERHQLSKYQSYLKRLITQVTNIEEHFKLYKYELTFDESEVELDESVVGKIAIRNSALIKKITNALKSKQFETKNVKFMIRHCIVLPNSNHILLSGDNNRLSIYDSGLNLVKTIEKIGFDKIDPSGIAIDCDEKSIYIADYSHNRIFKTDYQFNLIMSETVNAPLALSFSNKCLYVCQEYSLKKYSPDLCLQDSFELHFTPRNIKIIGSIALLRPFRMNCLYFYEISDNRFNLKQVVKGHNGVIGMIESTFYEYDNITRTMYRYNAVGELVEQIQTVDHGIGFGSIVFVNNKLIFPTEKNKIVSINL